jgi:hypothetical protein
MKNARCCESVIIVDTPAPAQLGKKNNRFLCMDGLAILAGFKVGSFACFCLFRIFFCVLSFAAPAKSCNG